MLISNDRGVKVTWARSYGKIIIFVCLLPQSSLYIFVRSEKFIVYNNINNMHISYLKYFLYLILFSIKYTVAY